MQRSTSRILTTHVGSLPRPEDLIPILQAKDNGREYDRELYAQRVSESVQGVVAKQAGIGVDVINDGEHSKASFTSYHRTRLTGFETTDKVFGSRAGPFGIGFLVPARLPAAWYPAALASVHSW